MKYIECKFHEMTSHTHHRHRIPLCIPNFHSSIAFDALIVVFFGSFAFCSHFQFRLQANIRIFACIEFPGVSMSVAPKWQFDIGCLLLSLYCGRVRVCLLLIHTTRKINNLCSIYLGVNHHFWYRNEIIFHIRVFNCICGGFGAYTKVWNIVMPF